MKTDLEKKFINLLEEHQNIAHKICRMYTYDADAHKDLFQEITVQLWKAYPKFSTWMYRVALNTAITLFRKKKRGIQTLPWENFDFKISAEGYDSTLDDNLKLMYAAIRELNDIDKALVLLYLEEKPYTEISETLGISEVNARVKMNRVKTKLKTILNP
ncbi:sigma-70 family RNA polymerase sigma factor [Psychroflexus sp. CAK57W]|uniref:RNA polymerase sigma factor n=1 Tax=Psychroflexus curvus TaxID=2873595 RepID=UPI001CCFD035|nr:sigma-70 family RNA polymerase sigma factor [Psychroflexus curvus]MBZ9788091.1 sigma-70 family RNA polymerase sigma factor [Psychroflexus curvus]